jgi:hypothetical protein
MPNIRESINEMIEESYLLSLSESEIRMDLERFVEMCSRVISENIHDKKQMQKLSEKLARARALSLVEDYQGTEDSEIFTESQSVRPSRKRFAEKVARNKRLILRAIRECDPRLEGLIEQERFPGISQGQFTQPLPLHTGSKSRAKDLFLKSCYLITLFFVLFLVYLALLQI